MRHLRLSPPTPLCTPGFTPFIGVRSLVRAADELPLCLNLRPISPSPRSSPPDPLCRFTRPSRSAVACHRPATTPSPTSPSPRSPHHSLPTPTVIQRPIHRPKDLSSAFPVREAPPFQRGAVPRVTPFRTAQPLPLCPFTSHYHSATIPPDYVSRPVRSGRRTHSHRQHPPLPTPNFLIAGSAIRNARNSNLLNKSVRSNRY